MRLTVKLLQAAFLLLLSFGAQAAPLVVTDAKLNGAATATVISGTLVTASVSVLINSPPILNSISIQIGAGAATCYNVANTNGSNLTKVSNISFTAPAAGTYNVTYKAYSDKKCIADPSVALVKAASLIVTPVPVTAGYRFTSAACVVGKAFGSAGQTCSELNLGQVAGTTVTGIYITVVDTNGIPAPARIGAGTTLNMRFAMSCINPVANAGVRATFSAVGLLPLCEPNGAYPGTWTANGGIVFAADKATSTNAYTFNYQDVGMVQMHTKTTALSGYSLPFVSKPAKLLLTEIAPTLNKAGRCGVSATPASLACANVPSDAITFAKAGEDFSMKVTAVGVGNVITPNYGQEITPYSAIFTALDIATATPLVTPVNGSLGAFVGGVATGSAFTYDEVGIIDIEAEVDGGNYLGAGNASGLSATHVGRFVPDHFTTIVTQGCDAASFTYSKQPFDVLVTAYNKSGAITQNYDGSTGFARNTTLSDGNGTLAGAFSSNVIASGSFVNGVASAKPVFTFTAANTAPVILSARATDADTGSAGFTEGAVNIRSGRVRLQNSSGSQFLDMPMVMNAEYYSGGAWVLNGADVCTGDTTLDPANAVSVSLSTLTLNANSTCVLDNGTPGLSSSGCAVAAVAAKRFKKGATPSVGFSGDFNLSLKASGIGKIGSVGVAASVPAWLRYNWTGVVANPTATATFNAAGSGVYKTPIIYIRENF